MKKILILFIGLFAISAAAKEPEQFDNQSHITVQNESGAFSCQAVRIAPKWYLTAAHCVRPVCDKECTVVVDLLQDGLQASAIVHHTDAKQKIFWPKKYSIGSADNIQWDIALILFDPAEDDYFFTDLHSGTPLSRQEFLQTLKKSEYREQQEHWNFLKKTRATLQTVTGRVSYEILEPIAVPDLSADVPAIGNGFYYFSELRHYIGPDIGIRHGMSGSGVILPNGAIIGIVSSALSSSGPLQVYNEKGEASGQVNIPGRYFLFTPMSKDNADFIMSKIKTSQQPDSLPRIRPIDSGLAAQTAAKLQDIFGEFSSAEDVLSVKGKK